MPANIRLGSKYVTSKNTLAYYNAAELITAVKGIGAQPREKIELSVITAILTFLSEVISDNTLTRHN
jgi:hypothetical protein